MNPNDRDLNDLLGEGGGRFGDLYRRLPRYEPPRRLDRAVLGEAARAVQSGKPPRRQRWIIGFGSAAGLVLAAGIAWRIGHEPIATDAGADRVRVVPVQPITESSRGRDEDKRSPAEPAASPPSASAPPSQPTAAVGDENSNRASAAQASAPREKAARPTMPQQPKPPAAAPEPPPPAAAAAPRPFAEPRDAEAEPAKSASADTGTVTTEPAAKSTRHDRAGPEPLRRAAPSSPPSSSVELQRDMQLAPDDWLSHIRELMQQDRRQQAVESLRLFVRAHPDLEVPADLQPLLD